MGDYGSIDLDKIKWGPNVANGTIDTELEDYKEKLRKYCEKAVSRYNFTESAKKKTAKKAWDDYKKRTILSAGTIRRLASVNLEIYKMIEEEIPKLYKRIKNDPNMVANPKSYRLIEKYRWMPPIEEDLLPAGGPPEFDIGMLIAELAVSEGTILTERRRFNGLLDTIKKNTEYNVTLAAMFEKFKEDALTVGKSSDKVKDVLLQHAKQNKKDFEKGERFPELIKSLTECKEKYYGLVTAPQTLRRRLKYNNLDLQVEAIKAEFVLIANLYNQIVERANNFDLSKGTKELFEKLKKAVIDLKAMLSNLGKKVRERGFLLNETERKTLDDKIREFAELLRTAKLRAKEFEKICNEVWGLYNQYLEGLKKGESKKLLSKIWDKICQSMPTVFMLLGVLLGVGTTIAQYAAGVGAF